MRFSLRLGTTILAATAMYACGGGGSSSSSGSMPTTPTAAPAPTATPATPAQNIVIVSIIGSSGTGAYSPNPVTVASGAVVVWKNNDSATHHIVMDNGSADLGNLAPGASTTATAIASGNFHCTIHPSMVGSINGSLPGSTMPGYSLYPTSQR